MDLAIAGGMSPMRALQCATLEASKLLKIEDRLGTIEPQKTADDVIAVAGNPLEDISVMQDVVFVMKEGEVFKGP